MVRGGGGTSGCFTTFIQAWPTWQTLLNPPQACTEAALPSTNCLHRAIRKSQQFLVKRMLRRRPSLLDYPGPNGYLPLANAIMQGEMCVIDVLLSAGCSVQQGNPQNGRTPLHVSE